MSKIITDKKRIDEVLTRGVAEVIVKDELRKKLASGKRLRIYCGFDPSAPSLHIGNAILLNKLSQFQALGHEVIFLIGDFTGTIGDPTDKLAVRKRLTRAQVLANAKNFKKQASAYLKFSGANPAKVMYNSAWHDKLTFKDLIKLSTHFTVQRMMERDMFQERLKEQFRCKKCNHIFFMKRDLSEKYDLNPNLAQCDNCKASANDIEMVKKDKPIYLHEFLYPLAQAYDSVAMNVDLEIGGNDQMFNMLCGRKLMKALGKKDKSVLMMELLVDDEGKKMGKTTGNALFLDTPAADMYGIVMSWSDKAIEPAWELATKEPLEAIKKLAKTKPRDAKMKLALAITALVHGVKAAQAAEARFVQTVQKKETPIKIKKISVTKNETLLAVAAKYFGAAKSKSDLRRLFEQGAVEVNGVKVKNFNQAAKSGETIKVGKKDWFKLN